MIFKNSERHWFEYWNRIDSRMRFILHHADTFSLQQFGKPLTITCLIRTKEENDDLNGRPYSSHLRGDGADCRTRHYAEGEADKLVDYIRRAWPINLLHIKRHVGTADHIHLNINWAFSVRREDD